MKFIIVDRIRSWLSAPDVSGNQKEAFRLRMSGTCCWFLSSDQFHDWKDGKSSVLWIQGGGEWPFSSVAFIHWINNPPLSWLWKDCAQVLVEFQIERLHYPIAEWLSIH